MTRIPYSEMHSLFREVFIQRGLDDERATRLATIIADNSRDGVYTHGLHRFARTVHEIEDGVIDKEARPAVVSSFGSIECWDGGFGIGPLGAWDAMAKAVELAHQHGVGLVAIGRNNHWLRGGTYGLEAADAGCISICWSNTKPNMPVWGGATPLVGNNPLIISVPKDDGAHFVFDAAMSQYSYGKLEEYRLKGEDLPFPGGFDKDGKLTVKPADIEETGRVLPIGYWKGSGLSLALDLVATALSGGLSVTEIGKEGAERGLTQVMIAIDPTKLRSKEAVEALVGPILKSVTESRSLDGRAVRYPGQRLFTTRRENLENGVPVVDQVWQEALALRR